MSDKPTWTPAQLDAIETTGKTLLVSAAAGSGKTATLTERIIRSITREENPADLSRLLIVTFTRASAADLKKKISAALTKALAADPSSQHLASQIMLLGSANISTIDSFYKSVLDKNLQKLSLPGNIRIIDNAENALLCRTIMEETIDEFYLKVDGFEDFVDHFASIRSLDRITETFLSLYDDLLSCREGHHILGRFEKELLTYSEQDFFETPYGLAIREETEATLVYIRNIVQSAENYFQNDESLSEAYLPSFRHDRQLAEAVCEATREKSYDRAFTLLHQFLPIRLKTLKNTDEYTNRLKDMRSKYQILIRDLKSNFFSIPKEQISAYMKDTAQVCHMAYRLLSAFDDKLMAEKRSRGVCYFSDVRRYVLQLLLSEDGTPTETALNLREQFDEIYIDEYQDTDEVQDLIFRTISSPTNRFMVGDIKQSIYGFRGAAPSIFASYKRTMPRLGTAESDANSIFMSNNFRCDENVVNFSNLISSYLFGNCSESVEYSENDDLVFTKSRDCGDTKTVVAVTGIKNRDSNKEIPPEESEIIYIANEICRLLREERKNDGTPIEPRDIAILMRKKTKLPILMEILQAAGIPVCTSEKNNFFENPDVLLILSLLGTIDNPQRDIPLAGTLCSPFYGFSLEDIVILRRTSKEAMSLYDALCSYAESMDDTLSARCREFMASLENWRYQAQALSVDKLLKKLYRDFAILSMQETEENNLLRLYDYARQFESGGFRGLNGFIRYLNELIEMGTTIGTTGENTNLNAVRLMTIHASKGLEFPVCFIYGTNTEFSYQFKKNKIQLVPSVGIGFMLHDESGMGLYDTPIRQALINERSRIEREEEMRVLYVAMTRARERLYVTAQVSNYEQKLEKAKNLAEFGKTYGIIKATSSLEWILAAIQNAGEESEPCQCLSLVTFNMGQIALPTIGVPSPSEDGADEAEADESITALLRERFSFAYPFDHVSELPAKLSVSRLYPAVLDEFDQEDILSTEDTDEDWEKDFDLPETLCLEKTVSAAERGIATHTFLQFCDFEAVMNHGVRTELARLAEKKFIPAGFVQLVNVRQLEAFFKSQLFDRIKRAKKVWREQRFNIFLPAADFTEDEKKAALLEDETIAVQGVIDLFFEDEDGNIILCDYKTDYLTQEELNTPTLAAEKLTHRHSLQLGYYARAIEQMCGKPPREILIYSLPLGKTVPVANLS